MAPTWLRHAPSEVERVIHGLPLELDAAGGEGPSLYSPDESEEEHHFRIWTMARFVDSQIASTDSLHSFTTRNLQLDDVPPSPASGPIRYIAEDQAIDDMPRDTHLPGSLRNPAAKDLLQETLDGYVTSYYPSLVAFLTRLPRESASATANLVWECPQCQYYFFPLNMGADEHAHLLGIAPHLEAVDIESGSVSIDASDHDMLLRYIDHFAYHHVDHAHLRQIGVYLEFPKPESAFPAPAVWYFVHDRPPDSDLTDDELSVEVLRDLLQTRRDFEKEDSRLGAELRSSLHTKASRAVRRTLHRLSVYLTISRYNQRLGRRDMVQGLFAAGRSITEVGRALVHRIRKDEEDADQQESLRQYYSYKLAYGAAIASGSC
ncbi:unnamed protein product [Peniophora sp. CBMAI 1063]|nr:unnamed protein product [Peniophora sp. CBMAI 1063]